MTPRSADATGQGGARGALHPSSRRAALAGALVAAPAGLATEPVLSAASWLVVAILAVIVAVGAGIPPLIKRRGRLSSPAHQATHRTLHVASQAARHLREGLTPQAASRAARDLRPLLGVAAVALCDGSGTLAWEGKGEHHRQDVVAHAEQVLATGRVVRLDERRLRCADPNCLIRNAILAPVVADERVVAALGLYHTSVSADLARATQAVADWIATQVELSELNRERARVVEAELRALRAQISPHFIYNSLAAIASFVRTDPGRARELLMEFADFTRYSLRREGAFAPLSEELGNIERYLALEQARFGDRLQVSLLIAPEVLTTAVPALTIQPLVENAVQHGIETMEGVGHISITAADRGSEAEIVIEDDGPGASPDVMRALLAGQQAGDHVGLANVDARLRQSYGDDYGLIVETAMGAGLKVSFRVPKYSPRLSAG